MKSLFLRIFLSFWACLAIILALGVGITQAVTAARFHALDGVSAAQLTADARHAGLRGRSELMDWAARTDAQYPTLQIFLVNRRGEELRGQGVPVRVRSWLADHLQRDAAATAAAASAVNTPALRPRATQRQVPPPPDTAAQTPQSWWDVPQIPVAGAEPLYLAFLPFDSSAYEVLGVSYVPALLLLCALVVSGPICWAMARHISAPVLKVQAGLRTLAKGDLNVRMDGAFAARRDELGALAGDFDTTAQRLQELVTSRETLLRDVSHELRSPLARLRVALDLARRQDTTQPAQHDRIERECERLDALIGQVLKLARWRAQPPAVHQPLDLTLLVTATLADVAYEGAARGQRVAWRAPTSPVWVLGEPAELASMLENVVRNALRFSPDGGQVCVELELRDGQALLTVLDEGPGIAEAELHKVFDAFFRADPSRAPDHKGAGLGLAIAHVVATRHGGGIVAANRPVGGLSVRMRLPLRAVPGASPGGAAQEFSGAVPA
ncbi:sensor histidine kinase [Hydrogenophaga palleronii]|uniref:sensor histidine kinase n=1 Tax=Hydrogenophaga palleronii TaxID=65655 RepID=UPI000824186E|nr:HAMP domain-containing sensor histidine kinase [Hydrogenophaga palleronii]